MKIDGSNDIARSTHVDKPTQKDVTAEAEFKDILKSSVERSKAQPAKIQTAPAAPMAPIRFTPLSPAANAKTVERVDSLLHLLEHYKDQLADPKVTLRSIEPLLNTIAKEKDQLSKVLDRLPNEDGLKDIVHRTLITASLEVMKFSRGDYISA
jgi:hypothetical protein